MQGRGKKPRPVVVESLGRFGRFRVKTGRGGAALDILKG